MGEPCCGMTACNLCHGHRPTDEMGWHGMYAYCHGPHDETPTCYEMANWPAEDVDLRLLGAQSITEGHWPAATSNCREASDG